MVTVIILPCPCGTPAQLLSVRDEKAEEGTVNLALGLGKYIVDGGMTLRFSPYHPNQVLQTSEMEIALKETQTRFYALDLKNAGHDFLSTMVLIC